MFDTIIAYAKKYQHIENPFELSEKLPEFVDVLESKPPFRTPAELLAFQGEEAAANLLYKLGASSEYMVRGYAAADNHKQVESFNKIYPDYIAAGYAMAGNTEKAREYIKTYKANPAFVARHYALVGNHDEVQALEKEFDCYLPVIFGYILAGNEEKVAHYLKILEVPATYLAQAYVIAGNHDKVLEYTNEENQVLIAECYALAGNLQKAEEFETKYQFKLDLDLVYESYRAQLQHRKAMDKLLSAKSDTNGVLELKRPERPSGVKRELQPGYTHHEVLRFIPSIIPIPNFFKNAFKKYHSTVPVQKSSLQLPQQPSSKEDNPFSKAVTYLSKQGKAGEQLIASMHRLQAGKDIYWNPYWMNSGKKLDLIITAILNLDNASLPLDKELENKTSALYKAINTQRLAPVTFLGRLGFNQSKTLLAVEEVIEKPKSTPQS